MITAICLSVAAGLSAQDGKSFDGYYVESRITAVGVGRNGNLFFGTDSGLIGWIYFPTDLAYDWRDSLSVSAVAKFDRSVSRIAVSPDGNYFTADQLYGELGTPVYLFRYWELAEVLFSANYYGEAVFSEDSSALFLPARVQTDEFAPLSYRKWDVWDGTSSPDELYLGDMQLRKVGIGAFGKVVDKYLEVTGPAKDGTYSVDQLGSGGHPDASNYGVWPNDSPLARISLATLHSWSGVRVACRSPDKLRINVYSILDGSLLRSIEHPTGIWYQEFYLASENILFAATARGEEIWNIETGEHLMTIRIVSDGRGPRLFALLPDGRYFASEPYPQRPSPPVSTVFPELTGKLHSNPAAVNQIAFDIWPHLSSDLVRSSYFLPWRRALH